MSIEQAVYRRFEGDHEGTDWLKSSGQAVTQKHQLGCIKDNASRPWFFS